MSEEAAAEKTFSKEIQDLGEKIVGLTLMQAKELGDYLKDVHGIEPAAGAVAVAAAPAAGGEAEAAEEKTSFDVILKAAGDPQATVRCFEQILREDRAGDGHVRTPVGRPRPLPVGVQLTTASAHPYRSVSRLSDGAVVVQPMRLRNTEALPFIAIEAADSSSVVPFDP